jgi:hypothetical protein
MDYAQVKEYAVLYAAQDLVLASHNELTRRFPSLGSIAQSLDTQILGQDPMIFIAAARASWNIWWRSALTALWPTALVKST